ncbi:MAG TPA: hypothetical protein VGC82_01520 [Rhodopila sp.]|jgi:hypothetical protein
MNIASRPGLAACAGLVAAPLLWAVNMQASQILPYFDCGKSIRITAVLSLFSLLLALGSGWVSWRARRFLTNSNDSARPLRFVAMLGCLAAVTFAFALLLQAAAGLTLTGCER